MNMKVMETQDIKKETALRYNDGKAQWSLVDFKSIEPMVRVLEFGAQKYSNYNFFSMFAIEQKLNEICVQNAKIQLKKLLQKDYVTLVTDLKTHQELNVVDVKNLDYFLENLDYVEAVMKKTDLKINLKNLKKKEDIKENIILNQKIFLRKEREIKEEEKTLSIKNKLKEKSFYQDCLNMDLQKNNIILFVNEDVQFVEVKKDFTLIMTIKLENLEIYCVVNVTKESDCYKILLKLVKKLLNISLNIPDISTFVSGKDNWKKDMSLDKILDSAQRHLASMIDGENIDNESKLEHAGHVMCNMMFYIYHYNKNLCCGNWDNEGNCKCEFDGK